MCLYNNAYFILTYILVNKLTKKAQALAASSSANVEQHASPTQPTSTLAPATGEDATWSPPSSTFGKHKNEHTRKSHHAVSKTVKVRRLQQEKIEKDAMLKRRR